MPGNDYAQAMGCYNPYQVFLSPLINPFTPPGLTGHFADRLESNFDLALSFCSLEQVRAFRQNTPDGGDFVRCHSIDFSVRKARSKCLSQLWGHLSAPVWHLHRLCGPEQFQDARFLILQVP